MMKLSTIATRRGVHIHVGYLTATKVGGRYMIVAIVKTNMIWAIFVLRVASRTCSVL